MPHDSTAGAPVLPPAAALALYTSTAAATTGVLPLLDTWLQPVLPSFLQSQVAALPWVLHIAGERLRLYRSARTSPAVFNTGGWNIPTCYQFLVALVGHVTGRGAYGSRLQLGIAIFECFAAWFFIA